MTSYASRACICSTHGHEHLCKKKHLSAQACLGTRTLPSKWWRKKWIKEHGNQQLFVSPSTRWSCPAHRDEVIMPSLSSWFSFLHLHLEQRFLSSTQTLTFGLEVCNSWRRLFRNALWSETWKKNNLAVSTCKAAQSWTSIAIIRCSVLWLEH